MADEASAARDTVLELWKRSEQIRFEQHLKALETAQNAEFQATLSRVKQVETKLKAKIFQLETKERELALAETEIKKSRIEMQIAQKRCLEEHQTAMKQVVEQHAFAMKMEREKLRVEEGKRKQIELELVSVKQQAAKKALPQKENNSNSKELELELRMKQFELDQAAQRERALLQSRDHFRTSVLKLTAEKLNQNRNDNNALGRLQQKRDELLASGLYHAGDEVIVQIDSKIHKASSAL